MVQLRLTHARLLVIKELLKFDGEFYGGEIVRELTLSPNVVYANLRAIEEAGYLTARREDHDERREDGDSRRALRWYFKVADQTRKDELHSLLRLRGYDRDVLPI